MCQSTKTFYHRRFLSQTALLSDGTRSKLWVLAIITSCHHNICDHNMPQIHKYKIQKHTNTIYSNKKQVVAIGHNHKNTEQSPSKYLNICHNHNISISQFPWFSQQPLQMIKRVKSIYFPQLKIILEVFHSESFVLIRWHTANYSAYFVNNFPLTFHLK